MKKIIVLICMISICCVFMGQSYSDGSKSLELKADPQKITKPWPTYKFDFARTGFDSSNDKATTNLQFDWNYLDPAFWNNTGPESSPVISNDGILYIGLIDHNQYGPSMLAFDLDSGTLLWYYSFGSPGQTSNGVLSTPTIDKKNIYVPTMHGVLYAINRKTGTLVWQKTLAPDGRLLRASPVVVDNVVYMGTLWYSSADPGTLYALDKASGATLDQVDIRYGIYSSPTLYNNYLYLMECSAYYHSTNDFNFYKIDISNPNSLQIVTTKSFNVNTYGGSRSSPVIDEDGVIYYTFNSDTVYMIDSDTLNVIDSYQYGDPSYGSPRGQFTPSIAYGNIYIATDYEIYALDLIALNDGDPATDPFVWSTDISPYLPHWLIEGFVGGSASIANGCLYIEAGDMGNGIFFALNALNGNVDWHYNAGGLGMGYSIATPAISDEYVVFVSAHDEVDISGIYVFKSQ
ncbi:PQQ-binding-like beta-propeller repeat protein [Thermoproteota archaeon]